MRTSLLALTAIIALFAAACASGDKAPKTAPTSTATTAGDATRAAKTAEAPEATAVPTRKASSSGEGGDALNDILPVIFNNALSSSAGDSPEALGLEPGDPALLQYLLAVDDLPAGYEPFGEFSFRVPDGISETGGGDMAASMAARGDLQAEDPSDVAMLMSFALKLDDITDLEDAFGQVGGLSPEEIEDALSSSVGDFPGIGFTEIENLPTDGLGEGAVGIGLTIDMSEFFGALAGSFGELDPEQQAQLDAFSTMSMRMYVFARGDLVGGVIRIGFGDSLSDGVDELGLARTVYGKLAQ